LKFNGLEFFYQKNMEKRIDGKYLTFLFLSSHQYSDETNLEFSKIDIFGVEIVDCDTNQYKEIYGDEEFNSNEKYIFFNNSFDQNDKIEINENIENELKNNDYIKNEDNEEHFNYDDEFNKYYQKYNGENDGEDDKKKENEIIRKINKNYQNYNDENDKYYYSDDENDKSDIEDDQKKKLKEIEETKKKVIDLIIKDKYSECMNYMDTIINLEDSSYNYSIRSQIYFMLGEYNMSLIDAEKSILKSKEVSIVIILFDEGLF
jgi:hypothetical protein